MGVSSSRLEEDKALQLCRERKKFVKQALNRRCSVATAHVNYIQSLKCIGTALGKFIEPEATVNSSIYASATGTTQEPALALTEKSLSNITFSPSREHISDLDAEGIFSTGTSPSNSSRFQTNCMKNYTSSPMTVEETPLPVSVRRTLSSSKSTPLVHTPRLVEANGNDDQQNISPEGTPWDYFGVHPIDSQFSLNDGTGMDHARNNFDDMSRFRDKEGVPYLEQEEEKVSFIRKRNSEESDDEFDKPSPRTLVRTFHNSQSSVKKINSPDLTPLKNTEPVVIPPTYAKKGDNIPSMDFLSTMKEIELLFAKASESGREVPRMLEVNKMHFRPVFPGKEGVSRVSICFKACFSCGEKSTNAPEETASTAVKYLTWHRSTSSRSTSFRTPITTSVDDMGDFSRNIFENFCMNSGSHVSTLDRLYAWEKKLYDEVKASGYIRREFDAKCRFLRHLESQKERSKRIDETRAVVKDLHSRIRVAIHRIDSISKKIEELRDKELQPQLEELIAGLIRMWKTMSECHKRQFQIISVASYTNWSNKISIHSESHRQATLHLEHELRTLATTFNKWVNAQILYVRSIDDWLHKCVSLRQKTSRRKRRLPETPLRDQGAPAIFVTSGLWLDKLEALPTKDLSDSIKNLEASAICLLPRQEKKNHKKMLEGAENLLKDQSVLEDLNSHIDNFRTSLICFHERLNNFASASFTIYVDLDKAIQEAKLK